MSDDQFADLVRRAADPVEPMPVDKLAAALAQRRKISDQHRRLVAAAVTLSVVVVLAAAVLVFSNVGDDHDDLTTVSPTTATPDGSSGSTNETLPSALPLSSAAFVWETVHPPPIDARGAAVVAWTGDEVVVVGGRQHVTGNADGAAFNPRTGTWRRISDAPLGQEIDTAIPTPLGLFVVGSDGVSPAAAIWSPTTNTWRSVAQPPPVFGQGWRQHPMVWTGDGVVAADRLSRWDAQRDEWTPIELPPDLRAELSGMREIFWHEGEVVVPTPRGRVLFYDPSARTWRASDPRPDFGMRIASGYSTASLVDGVVYVAGDNYSTLAYEIRSGTWSGRPSRPADSRNGSCIGSAWVGGRFVVNDCGRVRSWAPGEDRWANETNDDAAGQTCCLTEIVAAGDRVFGWYSDDDTRNNPAAPVTRVLIGRSE